MKKITTKTAAITKVRDGRLMVAKYEKGRGGMSDSLEQQRRVLNDWLGGGGEDDTKVLRWFAQREIKRLELDLADAKADNHFLREISRRNECVESATEDEAPDRFGGMKGMKRMLVNKQGVIWHFVDGNRIEGCHDKIRGYVTGLSGDVTGLSGYVTDISGDVTGLSGYVTGISGYVTGISGYVTGISGDVTGISGDVTGISGYVTGISGDVTGLRGDVTGLSGNVTGISGDVSDCDISVEDREVGVDIADLIAL